MRRFLNEISDPPTQEKSFDLENIRQQLKQSSDEKEFESHVNAYQELGDYYLQVKKDPINAIALYNFALGLVKGDQKNQSYKEKIKNYQEDIVKQIKAAEKIFLLSVTGKDIAPSSYVLDQAHQEYLKAIREEARAQLGRHQSLTETITLHLDTALPRLERIRFLEEKLEQEQLSIRQIYRDISEQLRTFVRLMIKECQEILGEPPCQYAVICFGSLARDEATPYSDLEFGILIEDLEETFQQLGSDCEAAKFFIERNKSYFRNLTKLLNIKVINLGETTPRMQYVTDLDWLLERFSESPVKRGFCFDGNNPGGRKTPLGNQSYDDVDKSKKYELIRTPRKMAELHSEEWYHKDKHLSTVIKTAALIEGNYDLLLAYQKAVICYLPENIMRSRALSLLDETTLKFEPLFGLHQEDGHAFSAKYDLYRLPQMLIEHLALYFNIEKKDVWNRIEKLHERSLWSKNRTDLFLWVISEINKLRLSTYLYYEAQEDFIFTDVRGPYLKPLLESYHRKPMKYFIKLYEVLLPFYYRSRNFCYSKDIAEFERKIEILENIKFIKGNIHQLLFDYEEAIFYYRQVIKFLQSNSGSLCDFLGLSICYAKLGDVYEQSGDHQNQNKYYKKMIEAGERSIDVDEVVKLKIQAKCADGYFQILNHEESLKIYDHILSSYNGVLLPNDVAIILHNRANVYRSIGAYPTAIQDLQEANTLFELHDKNGINYIRNLNLLAESEVMLGSYESAITRYKKAIRLSKMNFGNYHPILIEIYTDLSTCYLEQSLWNEAERVIEKAKRIYERHFEDRYQRLYAHILQNFAKINQQKGSCDTSKTQCYDAIEILEKEFGKNSPSAVPPRIMLAEINYDQGNFEKAEDLLNQCDLVYVKNRFLSHPNRIRIKMSYVRIKLDCGNKRKLCSFYSQLKKKCQEIKDLSKEIYPNYEKNTSFAALCILEGYVHLRCARNYLDRKKSFSFFIKSLQILRSLYKENHYRIAQCYIGLADYFQECQKNYQQALMNLQQSLKIYEVFYPDFFIEIIKVENHLALVYKDQENYKNAINYFDSAIRRVKEKIKEGRNLNFLLSSLLRNKQELLIQVYRAKATSENYGALFYNGIALDSCSLLSGSPFSAMGTPICEKTTSEFFKVPERYRISAVEHYVKSAEDLFLNKKLEESRIRYLFSIRILKEKSSFGFSEEYDYKIMKKCLLGIAKIYIEFVKKTEGSSEWFVTLMNALIFNNAAWVVSKKFLDKTDRDICRKTKERIQDLLLSKINVSKIFQSFNFKNYDMELHKINRFVKKSLIKNVSDSEKKDDLCADGIKDNLIFQIYDEIALKMEALIKDIFDHCDLFCKKIFNIKKFSYSVISFGSLARGAATDYSDIEFGILIEECVCGAGNFGECEHIIERKKYLRTLSYLFCFHIVNLKKTTIPKVLLNHYDIYFQNNDKNSNIEKIRNLSIVIVGSGEERKAYFVENGKFITYNAEELSSPIIIKAEDEKKLVVNRENRVIVNPENIDFLLGLIKQIKSVADPHNVLESYEIEIDDFLDKGLQLDQGDKIAVKKMGASYELIQTPTVMVSYLEKDMGDQFLPIVLMKAKHLYGDESLTYSYQNKVNFLVNMKNEFFMKKIVGQDNTVYKKNQETILCRIPNVKREIYRPITVLVELLCLHYKVYDCSHSIFQHIHALSKETRLYFFGSHKLFQSFFYALYSALKIRLISYNRFGQKYDQVNLISLNFPERNSGEKFLPFSLLTSEKSILDCYYENKKLIYVYMMQNCNLSLILVNFMENTNFSINQNRYVLEENLFEICSEVQNAFNDLLKNQRDLELIERLINVVFSQSSFEKEKFVDSFQALAKLSLLLPKTLNFFKEFNKIYPNLEKIYYLKLLINMIQVSKKQVKAHRLLGVLYMLLTDEKKRNFLIFHFKNYDFTAPSLGALKSLNMLPRNTTFTDIPVYISESLKSDDAEEMLGFLSQSLRANKP